MMQEPLPTLKALHIAALVLLLAFSVSVKGTPSINLPINAQVPPVARPNHPYQFAFSDSTFSWAGSSIDYSLTNYSGWLQLDSSSGVFSGTPGSADAGSFVVGLVATDVSGSSSTSVTFVVSADPGPGLGTSIEEQLPAFGPVPSPGSLSLAPSTALSLSFSPNTFTNTNGSTVYYAICANNTPLPSWINFHSSSLTFSGTTPSSTSPWELPQAFRIQLIASNVLGFAEAIASFQLVITNHLLAFGNSSHVINTTTGVLVNFLGLQHDLTLDGQPAKSSDIRQVVASTPPWMSLNSSTLSLSGRPPANAASQNFTVTASDIFGDTASTVVLIQNIDNLTDCFTGPFATVNATAGAYFTYDLNSKIVPNPRVNVAVDLGAASAWLNFNSSSLQLQGYIPTDLKSQSVQVIVTATQGTQIQPQSLTVDIQNASASTSQTTDSRSMPPKATSSSTGRGNQSEHTASSASGPKRKWIAAAVLVPVFVALGCLLLLCFYLKRRRRRKKDKEPSTLKKWKITRPIQEKDVAKFEVHATAPGVLPVNERPASARGPKAPWLDVLRFQTSSNSNRGSGARLSNATISSVEHCEAPISANFIFPARVKDTSRKAGKIPWGLKTPPSPIQRLSVIVDSSPTKRISKQRKHGSNLSYDTTSAFSSQRLSGIGHGRSTLSRTGSNLCDRSKGVGHGSGLSRGPPGFGIVRNSWRNLSRSTWASTDASDLDMEREATLGRFPSKAWPPMPKSFSKGSCSRVIREVSDDEGNRRPTLRPVLSPTQSRIRKSSGSPSRIKSNLLRTDPLQTFHKHRLQRRDSRNPLFSAGPSSSRLSSMRRMSKTAPLEPTASQSGSTSNNTTSERPTTPQRRPSRRSYSESSSLDPPVRPSVSKSPGSPPTSPGRQRQKSYIKYRLTPRALSPRSNANRPPPWMNSRGSSWVSTSSDSKLGSAGSGEAPPFSGFGEDLREGTDENGNKRWLRGHPNPLGTHRLDVTDQELIDRLRVSGSASAAQRLSYLISAQTEGKADDGAESVDEGAGGQVKIGSTKKKRLGQGAGLKVGDAGTRSMRGDIGSTTAGSAFI